MPARGARDRDAAVGLGFGEVKGLCAVDEHGGEGLAREQPALVDLADVGDEVGLDAARLADELVESPQQLVVGDVVESESGLHLESDGWDAYRFHELDIAGVLPPRRRTNGGRSDHVPLARVAVRLREGWSHSTRQTGSR